MLLCWNVSLNYIKIDTDSAQEIDIIDPEKLAVLGVVFLGATTWQPHGKIFEMLTPDTEERLKELVKEYIRNFE